MLGPWAKRNSACTRSTRGRKTPFFTDRERAALAWTEAVTLVSQTHVPDDVYEEAKKHFSEQELVDLTLALGMINLWNRLAISTRRCRAATNPPTREPPPAPDWRKACSRLSEREAIAGLWSEKLSQDARGLPQSERHRNLEPAFGRVHLRSRGGHQGAAVARSRRLERPVHHRLGGRGSRDRRGASSRSKSSPPAGAGTTASRRAWPQRAGRLRSRRCRSRSPAV
jgi:hypothetical protein